MSKIIKAQAGVAVKSIPVQRYPAINVGEIVSNLTKRGAEVGHEAISVGSRIGKGALKILSGPLGILTLALSDNMDAQQPYSEGARMRETYRLAKNVKYTGPVLKNKPQEKSNFQSTIRAIPVAGQSSTATPAMAKKKKKRVAVGQEQETPRDTVRVENGAATGNATPQDTTKVDDRNILQKLGDAWAKRKKQNGSTENPENKPPKKWRNKIKTVGKWGMYSFVANEADNRFLNGGVKKIVKGALDLGFDKPDTIYIEKPNNTQRLQTTINTPEQVIGYPTENDYR